LSSSEIEESHDNNNVEKKMNNAEINKNKRAEMLEDLINSSSNLHKMNKSLVDIYKDKRQINYEGMDEFNSDWSNYT
jgi:hypothetical protein